MRASAAVRLAMRAVGGAALLLGFLDAPVRAQAGASTGLMGQVTDSSGAAVPGVTVTLTHVETRHDRTVTTGPRATGKPASFLPARTSSSSS